MKQFVTKAIVLARTNFDEADRIITFLTPDYGKLRLMARGARRVKSKLAGGIELFSISDITFIRGRGEIGTLSSARLRRHYAGIIKDIDRTMTGYEIIKKINKVTEDAPESDYFDLLEQAFEALEDPIITIDIIQLWLTMQLLRVSGHGPNLRTDADGHPLDENRVYLFDFSHMSFALSSSGQFGAKHIKFLRLGFSTNSVKVLQMVQSNKLLIRTTSPLVNQMGSTFLN